MEDIKISDWASHLQELFYPFFYRDYPEWWHQDMRTNKESYSYTHQRLIQSLLDDGISLDLILSYGLELLEKNELDFPCFPEFAYNLRQMHSRILN